VRSPQSIPEIARRAEVRYRKQSIELEYAWILPENPGPLVVFLHEGLGSLHMWRGFPRTLCAAVGCRGLVYSRAGYGGSTALWPDRNWPVEFMREEAREILPNFLAAVGIDTAVSPPVLFGHSDGASIALIYAGSFPDRLSRLIAVAPHVFVEDLTVTSIVQTRRRAADTDLLQRLKKYHGNVEHVFWGWAGVWLNPEFRRWNIEECLEQLVCPTLIVQGYDDQYGTMRQVDSIAAAANHARIVKLPDCGHSPHVDQPDALISASHDFMAQGLKVR
jgi:pimeloyl-ACP methyl ester carboxylesterase